jgi:hypothetical protein
MVKAISRKIWRNSFRQQKNFNQTACDAIKSLRNKPEKC